MADKKYDPDQKDSAGTDPVTGNFKVGISGVGDRGDAPLNDLEKDDNQITQMQYPMDLGSFAKPHGVIFYISEVKSMDYATIEKFGKSLVEKEEQAVAAAEEQAKKVEEASSSGKGFVGGIQSVADLVGEQIKGTYNDIVGSIKNIKVNGKDFAKKFRPDAERVVSAIRLYMPDTLQFAYQAQYDKLSLAQAAGSVPLVGGIARAITSTETNAAVRLTLNKFGYTFNPQAQATFNGIDFREFDMSFTFTPTSQKESDMVREIIKTFRMYAAPTVVDESFGFFFKPPGLFDIVFVAGDSENQYINKVRRSVMTNITVDYAPNQNWAAFKTGAPIQTTITMSFRETELVDRNSIMDEYK